MFGETTSGMIEVLINAIKLHYVGIAEARRLPGLRIVLGAYADPATDA